MNSPAEVIINPVDALVHFYTQWKFGVTKPRTAVLPKNAFSQHPDRNYSLKNMKAIKYLQHEEQTFGINLGWTDDASNSTGNRVARWFFSRTNNSDAGPIRYGETIALANGEKPSFVQFASRTVGVNLTFSNSPSFEWKILGGKIGDPVYTHDLVAIFNSKSEKDGECLVYFDRTVGGDIGWPSSKTWDEQIPGKLGNVAWEVAKKGALKVLGIG